MGESARRGDGGNLRSPAWHDAAVRRCTPVVDGDGSRPAIHDLTAGQWTALMDEWGGCAYCGQPDEALQKDCILPISRGGRYTLNNVAPACRPCNASKCNSEVTQWMRRKKLDEHRFLVRQFQISRIVAEADQDTAADQAPS